MIVKMLPFKHFGEYESFHDVPKELGRALFELDVRVFDDAFVDQIWKFCTELDAPDEYEQIRLYWHWSNDGPINVPIPMIPDVEEVGEYYMKQRLSLVPSFAMRSELFWKGQVNDDSQADDDGQAEMDHRLDHRRL